MKENLLHRGPDSQGTFEFAGGGFAHTRLSILDLSDAGRQPMTSHDGRFVITFNGEIYNFAVLRAELEARGVCFATRTDTEVILEAYRAYGENCVGRFEGMFAFAIWDRNDQTCFLARDAIGIKPLYYHLSSNQLVFASEVRALSKALLGATKLDAESVFGYLLYGSVQEPKTIWEGIRSLPAGHWMRWKAGKSRMERYWKLIYNGAEKVDFDPVACTREALMESVERHFVSDAPVGVFLSGGIDSTAVVALASRVLGKKLNTFSIAFDHQPSNEGPTARRTADHFGTTHHEWLVTPEMGRELFRSYFECVDQPTLDGFNVYCVSQFARRQGMKVVLSGLGGDEFFAGYPSFLTAPRLYQRLRSLECAKALLTLVGRCVSGVTRQAKWAKFGALLKLPVSLKSCYWAVRGTFTPAEAEELSAHYLGSQWKDRSWEHFFRDDADQPTIVDQVSAYEVSGYMRNQLLRDSDVFSMASGLELRVPFVDRKLVDSISRIPTSIRLAQGKKLLLDAVPEIPEWVRNRKKQGFSFPFEHWMSKEWDPFRVELPSECKGMLTTWYRKWCVHSLEHVLRNGGAG